MQEAGDADLVHHLRGLAGSGPAEQAALAGVGQNDLPCGIEVGRLVGATHHGELSVLGARLATRHRGVDETEPALGARRRELAGHVSGGGGVVDERRAVGHRGDGAVLAERDLADVVVVPDAHQHELRPLDRLRRGRRRLVAVLGDPCEGGAAVRL